MIPPGIRISPEYPRLFYQPGVYPVGTILRGTLPRNTEFSLLLVSCYQKYTMHTKWLASHDDYSRCTANDDSKEFLTFAGERENPPIPIPPPVQIQFHSTPPQPTPFHSTPLHPARFLPRTVRRHLRGIVGCVPSTLGSDDFLQQFHSSKTAQDCPPKTPHREALLVNHRARRCCLS